MEIFSTKNMNIGNNTDWPGYHYYIWCILNVGFCIIPTWGWNPRWMSGWRLLPWWMCFTGWMITHICCKIFLWPQGWNMVSQEEILQYHIVHNIIITLLMDNHWRGRWGCKNPFWVLKISTHPNRRAALTWPNRNWSYINC